MQALTSEEVAAASLLSGAEAAIRDSLQQFQSKCDAEVHEENAARAQAQLTQAHSLIRSVWSVPRFPSFQRRWIVMLYEQLRDIVIPACARSHPQPGVALATVVRRLVFLISIHSCAETHSILMSCNTDVCA